MTRKTDMAASFMKALVIVIVPVFSASLLSTAPASAAGSSSTSMPEKKCKKGFVWSKAKKKCIRKTSELLTDDDLFWQARAYVDEKKYELALDLLHRVRNPDQPRVLNYIGYSTRKLGDVEKGITYYKKALSIDPDYILSREYLGEGYLQKGDLKAALNQLAEISKRCGAGCEEYRDLAEAIARYRAKNQGTSS